MTEQPTCCKTITRTAIKQHKCCECGTEINSGEQYKYTSGIWGGEPQSYKQCLNCDEIMSLAVSACDSPDEFPYLGHMREWFFEFMCIGYKGKEFLNGEAERIGTTPEKLNNLLKIELSDK